MAKDKKFFSKSLLISIALHAIFFALLFTSLAVTTNKPPLMVNLQRDPKNDQGNKIVKAKVIDKRAVDLELQRQLAEEQKAFEKQKLAEQQALEKVKAKQLEQELIAKQAAEAKLKLQQERLAKQKAQQELQIKKEKAAEKLKVQQELAMKEAEKKKALQQAQEIRAKEQALAAKQAAAKELAAKQATAAKEAAAKQAAALKAQQDILAAQHAEFMLSEVEKYRAAIQALIEDNRVILATVTANISCKIRITLLPDGSILSAKVVETSGNSAYDDMSISAVYKSAPFPMPEDQELFNQLRDVILSFKNGEQTIDG